MADRQSIKIKIFGTEYVLKGDSDPQYMQELAEMVDQKMRRLGEPGTVQINRVAILAAFQFADELMKARRTIDTERQEHDKAARILAQLDLKIQETLHSGTPAAPAGGAGLSMEEAPAEHPDTAQVPQTENQPEDENGADAHVDRSAEKAGPTPPILPGEGSRDLNWK
jgi:cell division protein ZapA